MEIKKIRKELGFTQKKMAALMCVNPRTIRRYEAGEVALTKGRAELLRLKIEAMQAQPDHIIRLGVDEMIERAT